VWEDAPANFSLIRGMLDGTAVNPGDLVVLPELFDSGFSLNTDRTTDRDGRTLDFLRELARETRATIHGSRTVLTDGATHATNRASIAFPDGSFAEYAKIHPFTFGREPERFEGGDSVTTYEWPCDGGRSLKVCPAVCYDLRFPELFRAGLSKGAEVFVLGANWPEARHEHWRTLLRARAIENQAFVLGVNRAGKDPHLGYKGGSAAIGPEGETIGELGEEPGVLSVEIDPGTLTRWREMFPAWRDARLPIGLDGRG